MIIRASDLQQKETTSLEWEVLDGEFQKNMLLRELPQSLLDQEELAVELIDFIAQETVKAIEAQIENPLRGKPRDLFSSRIILGKKDQLRSVLADESFVQTVGAELESRFENKDFLEEIEKLEPEEETFLKYVAKKMLRMHVRIYLLNLLEELEELFLEREDEEREIMSRYFPKPEEFETPLDDPNQLMLF